MKTPHVQLIPLIFLLRLTNCCYLETFYDKSGNTVADASYLTFSTISLLLCGRRCKLQRKCLSFNFDTRDKKCYLNYKSHVTPGVLLDENSIHIRSFDISVWSDEVLNTGSCSNHSCRHDLVCSEGGSDPTMSYTCTGDTQCQWNEGCTSCIEGSGSTIQANLPDYTPIGCYHAGGNNIGFTSLVNFRGQIDWKDLESIIRRCVQEARTRQLTYFGIEYYGECYMRNDTLEALYSRVSSNLCTQKCIFGVGAADFIFFYRII